MGNGCGRRNRPDTDAQQQPGHLQLTTPTPTPTPTPQRTRHFFLGREWQVALTPREKFKAAVRRVIAFANFRKKTAYSFQLLNQLKDLAKNGRPSPQALFMETERKKGLLSRTDFFAWQPVIDEPGYPVGSGYWRRIADPIAAQRSRGEQFVPNPYRQGPRVRPYGRVLTHEEATAPQTTITRLMRDQTAAAKRRAKAKPKAGQEQAGLPRIDETRQ